MISLQLLQSRNPLNTMIKMIKNTMITQTLCSIQRAVIIHCNDRSLFGQIEKHYMLSIKHAKFVIVKKKQLEFTEKKKNTCGTSRVKASLSIK